MDILIDLIVYLMKRANQSRDGKAAALTPQQSVRQRAALDQQIRAMRQIVPGVKKAGTSPKGRKPVSRPPSPAPAPPQTLPPERAKPSIESIPVVQRRSGPLRGKMAGSMRLPFILGEVLSTPVALRESEF